VTRAFNLKRAGEKKETATILTQEEDLISMRRDKAPASKHNQLQ